jgi:hypothetical protein
MTVQRLVGINTFNIEGWVERGRTRGFVYELVEIGSEVFNLATKLFLDEVHFGMKGRNVVIHFGLKSNKVNTQLLNGFLLVGGSH